jgi:hypothetical protein
MMLVMGKYTYSVFDRTFFKKSASLLVCLDKLNITKFDISIPEFICMQAIFHSTTTICCFSSVLAIFTKEIRGLYGELTPTYQR